MEIEDFHGFQINNTVKYNKGICPVAEKLHNETFIQIGLCNFEWTNKEVDLITNAFTKVWQNLEILRNAPLKSKLSKTTKTILTMVIKKDIFLKSNLIEIKNLIKEIFLKNILSWLNDSEVTKYSQQRFVKYNKNKLIDYYYEQLRKKIYF